VSANLWQVLGVSAIVSGAITAGTQLFINRRFFDYQLRRQHEQDERRKLRELISRYQGRLLEAALDWDRRAEQIYDGHFDDLRPPEGQWTSHEQYYFQSVVFRFLHLMAMARRLEGEAFYIDAEIAEERDFDLLRYAKALLWVVIHADISPEDGMPGIDHFRSDAFRPLLDLCYSEDARLPRTRTKQRDLIFDWKRFMAVVENGAEFAVGDEVTEVLAFFHGINPDDYDLRYERRRQRRRWDRLIALHLIVLGFIDQCGYRWDAERVTRHVEGAVEMLLYPDDLEDQFAIWLPRLGLSEGSMGSVQKELGGAAEASRAESPNERAARVVGLVDEKRQRRRAEREKVSLRMEEEGAAR
jgi:hypothetical protein